MAKQIVLSGNRVVAHGEDCFLCMGGTVVCEETGRSYSNATIAEVDAIPADIDSVGYEYRAGVFVPCAPYGKGTGNLAVVCNDDCKAIKDSGMPFSGLLADDTKTLFGLGADAVPDDVFKAIKNDVFAGLNTKVDNISAEVDAKMGNVICRNKEKRIAGNMPVGSVVSIPIGGVPTDFIVVQHGKPSDAYSDSCNGTWLLAKDIYTISVFDDNVNGETVNRPDTAAVTKYLDGLVGLFDRYIATGIKTVKVPYSSGNGHTVTNVNTGENGLSAKLFLLSGTETGTSSSNMSVEGATLEYFKTDATNRRIAYKDGVATNWWTRSPYARRGDHVFYVTNAGALSYGAWGNSYGVRPAFIVPSDFDFALVQPLTDSDGAPILIDGAQVLSKDKIAVGTYVGTGGTTTNNTISLTFDFVPKIVFITTDTADVVAFVTPAGGVAIDPNSYSEFYMYNVTATLSGTTLTIRCYYGYLVLKQSPTSYNNNHAVLNASGQTYNYIAIG